MSNNVIPTSYNRENTDIQLVEIGCGIDTINGQAFLRCTSLKKITILGNIDYINDYAFSNCTSLDTLEYYGTKVPTYANSAFRNSSLSIVQVTKDYEGEEFCGMPINRSL